MVELVGRNLGQYRIVGKIGAGGMATVYLAYQASLQREVAIKVLHDHLSRDAEVVRRFQREAHNAAVLAHTNIIHIYDVGQDFGIYYIVMDYVAGGNLAQRLKAGRPLDGEMILNIVRQVGAALDYAHARGVVHRDVKPSNILLTPDAQAVLSDFGIASVLAEARLTQSGTVIGTPEYMSPEQAQAGRITGASDLYSLGVVLYEMLTGRLPFYAENPVVLLYKQVHERPTAPSLLNRAISRPVEQVVLRAIDKAPERRFASAAEMFAALSQALRVAPGRPVVGAMTPPPIQQVVRPPAPPAGGQTRAIGQVQPGPLPQQAPPAAPPRVATPTPGPAGTVTGRTSQLLLRSRRLEADGDLAAAVAAYEEILQQMPAGSSLHAEVSQILPQLRGRLRQQASLVQRAEEAREHELARRWREAAEIYEGLLQESGITLDQAAAWQAAAQRCRAEIDLVELFGEALKMAELQRWQGAAELLADVLPLRAQHLDNVPEAEQNHLAAISYRCALEATGAEAWLAAERFVEHALLLRPDVYLYRALQAAVSQRRNVPREIEALRARAAAASEERDWVQAEQISIEALFWQPEDAGLAEIRSKARAALDALEYASDAMARAQETGSPADWEAALRAIQAGLRQVPDDATLAGMAEEAESQVAWAGLVAQAEEALEAGRWAEALQLLEAIPERQARAAELRAQATEGLRRAEQIQAYAQAAEQALAACDWAALRAASEAALNLDAPEDQFAPLLERADQELACDAEVAATVSKARELAGRGEWAEALAALEHALALRPDCPEALALRAEIEPEHCIAQRLRAIRELVGSGAWEQALAMLQELPAGRAEVAELRRQCEAERQRLQDLRECEEAAEAARQAGDWEGAARAYQRALGLGGDSERLGAALEEVQARVNAETAASLLAQRAAELAGREDWPAAAETLQRAVDRWPENADYPVLLAEYRRRASLAEARAASQAGDWQRALAALESLPADDEDAETLRREASAVHEHAQAVLSAKAAVREAIGAGRYDQAVEAARALTDMAPGDAEAQSLAEEAQATLERHREAIGALREAAAGAETAGDWAAAAKALEQLATLEPEDREIRERLATAQREAEVDQAFHAAEAALGDRRWKEALRQAERARRLFPEREAAAGLMARAQEGLTASRKRLRVALGGVFLGVVALGGVSLIAMQGLGGSGSRDGTPTLTQAPTVVSTLPPATPAPVVANVTPTAAPTTAVPPTVPPTATATATRVPTATATPTKEMSPTATPTRTPLPTNTPAPTAPPPTNTRAPTAPPPPPPPPPPPQTPPTRPPVQPPTQPPTRTPDAPPKPPTRTPVSP